MDSQDEHHHQQQQEQGQHQEQPPVQQHDDDADTPVEVTGAFKVLSEEELAGLTKSARRRYAKDLRFHEFKAKRLEKRALERQREKEKRKARAAAGLPARPPKINRDRVPSGVRVVIDLDFPGHMMQLKDTKSLSKQVSFCYAANRKHAVSVDLMATGMSSALEDVLKSQYPTFRNWDSFPIYQQGYMDMLATDNPANDTADAVKLPKSMADPDPTQSGPKPLPPPPAIPKSSLVYLTGDSPNVLTSLDPGKTYIIGGLVDHNQFKKLCLNRAEEQGIAHAQLPIGDHIKLNSRRVLAVNHCFEIMIKVLENGGDWSKALNEVMPERKVGDQPKERKRKKGNRVSKWEEGSADTASATVEAEADEDEESLEGDEDQADGGIKRPRSPSLASAGGTEQDGGSCGADRPAEKRVKTEHSDA